MLMNWFLHFSRRAIPARPGMARIGASRSKASPPVKPHGVPLLVATISGNSPCTPPIGNTPCGAELKAGSAAHSFLKGAISLRGPKKGKPQKQPGTLIGHYGKANIERWTRLL